MFDSFYAQRPLVIAHRGAQDVTPENTMAAFAAALVAGADGIELDVTRCQSGEIVVIHDDTVDRTTDGAGRIEDLPLSALRELDAGGWFGVEFAGERLPLLSQVLDRFGGQIGINIEIKGRALFGDGIEAEVAQMVRGRGLGKTVIVSSFNPWALARIRTAAPELQRALLHASRQPLKMVRAEARHIARPAAMHPQVGTVDAAYMSWAHRQGYRVNVWTVNDDPDLERMIGLGVDGIITDHPARALALVAGRALADTKKSPREVIPRGPESLAGS